MNIEVTPKAKSMVELQIEVTPAEYEKHLKTTAQKMSQNHNIKGFRQGKVPYDIIKQKFGESEILNQALSDIVTHTFVKAIKTKNLNTVSRPEIKVKKIAAGNPLVYTALVAIMPEVNLPDIESIAIKKKKVKVEDKEIDKTLNQLARSRATEKLVDRQAKSKDMVKMDYNIFIAGVPQEDGQAKDFTAYLGEKHMVPGFEENIIGLKAGDKKTFTIKFPKNYFQKNFAGKNCDFKVNIKGVYEINIPKLDDEFAKGLGQFKNLTELRQQIANNLTIEKENKAARETERELIDALIAKTKFSDIPEEMIINETNSIIHELEHDLTQRGLQIETWLTNMNKKMDEFKTDLKPQAINRIKGALIVRAVGDKEKITLAPEEVDVEIKKIKEQYKDNPEMNKQIGSPQYREYLANIMKGEKVMNWLKEKILTD